MKATKEVIMKILFLYPNSYLSIGIPQGIATLSALLKENGHEVKVFDFTFLKTKKSESQDYTNTMATCYVPTAYTLEDLVRNDPVVNINEHFCAVIQEFKPDFICLSAMSSSIDEGIKLLNNTKHCYNCPVIAGGVHSTIAPEDVLRNSVIDYVCIGEGEYALLDFYESISTGKDPKQIDNLAYNENGKLRINKLRPFICMDDLPVPDWALFDQRHLFRPFKGKIYTGSFYIMSRGCLYNCSYCVNTSLKKIQKSCGRYFRFQSPKKTINDLTYLKNNFNATWFKFADDSIMMFDNDYLQELREGLMPLNIMFGCSVRPETVTREKVALLKEMGCVAMSVGIESGNEQIRRNVLNRKMSNELVKKAFNIINEFDIRVSTFNMIGLPNETRENVFETIRFNKELSVEACNVYVIYPYPGTELAIKYNKYFRDENGEFIPVKNAADFELSQMSPEEIKGLLKVFNLYLKLPEEFWPLIKIAEQENEEGRTFKYLLSL